MASTSAKEEKGSLSTHPDSGQITQIRSSVSSCDMEQEGSVTHSSYSLQQGSALQVMLPA